MYMCPHPATSDIGVLRTSALFAVAGGDLNYIEAVVYDEVRVVPSYLIVYFLSVTPCTFLFHRLLRQHSSVTKKKVRERIQDSQTGLTGTYCMWKEKQIHPHSRSSRFRTTY